MKKFLLSTAFILGAFAAQADYAEYFKVYYNGKEVKNGGTILCDHYSDNTDNSGYNMGYTYEANITFVNQTEDAIGLYTTQGFLDMPTEEEYKNQPPVDYTTTEWYQKWGTVALCYAKNLNRADGSFSDNCVSLPFTAALADQETMGDKEFQWQFHLSTVNPDTESKYTVSVKPVIISDYNGNGVITDYEEIPDSEFTVILAFKKDWSGVDSIDADNDAAPEYYTIQGVRVANPEKGLYIVKKGNKVSKEFIR